MNLSRFGRCILVVAGIVALSSCHANVLYRIDIHPDNIATITLHETFDSELYALASSSGGSDPFGLVLARKQGWNISQHATSGGGMSIVLNRNVPVAQISSAISGSLSPADPGSARLSMPKMSITSRHAFFSNRVAVHAVFPAVIRKHHSAMDAVGASMAASLISIQLQLRAPGKIVSTNGAALANGFVQWTISPIRPTPIVYVVEVPNVANVIILLLAGVALLVVVGFAVARQRRVS
ncbi:MAG: hypothetical protein HKL92_00480 [Candidatus Eremiobacteraeota bacterium]|nr:hypothetical protein [Candidatus Eremiobacteraeota bacterium]NNM91795.1 hypothetical protein [Candidatus Eremiobacteraeota bacterium]